jgi:iron complex outermembrane receptor protein
LLAFEFGYRVRPDDNFAVDFAAFYDIYDHLATEEVKTAGFVPCPTPPFFVCFEGTSQFDNRGSADTYGLEVGTDIRPAPWWQLHGAYTFLVMDLDRDAGSNDPLIEQTDGRNPHHQISVRSEFDLSDNWDFDIWARYVSDLPERGVDSYFTFDTRLGWRPMEGIELSLVGQNLLAGHHLEFTPELVDTTPTEIQRSVYGKVTVTF